MCVNVTSEENIHIRSRYRLCEWSLKQDIKENESQFFFSLFVLIYYSLHFHFSVDILFNDLHILYATLLYSCCYNTCLYRVSVCALYFCFFRPAKTLERIIKKPRWNITMDNLYDMVMTRYYDSMVNNFYFYYYTHICIPSDDASWTYIKKKHNPATIWYRTLCMKKKV